MPRKLIRFLRVVTWLVFYELLQMMENAASAVFFFFSFSFSITVSKMFQILDGKLPAYLLFVAQQFAWEMDSVLSEEMCFWLL